ncbi:MAG: DNA-directed RNA polymerase subunit B, partial [Candidatus Wukongarchaeota archaeon]|nr:DNA-directed RNA polymerase subunit B [Candidatus Wukongarchaeota archaeon]
VDHEVNVAIYEDIHEIQVNCDAGRARRPCIIVENGRTKLRREHIDKLKNNEWQWSDLIVHGIIEYLDAEEEENSLIAMYPSELTEEYTHLEIEPSTILGITGSLIPYPAHNQSPRNTYEAGMAKQALGLYAPNYRIRVDTRAHLLHYSQTPIVRTQTIDLIGYDKRAAGQNFVVAVLSYEGYNIEDALVINKASIERGLARSTFFRTYDAEERKYPGGQEDRFEIPTKDIRGYRIPEAYRYLNEDGIIEPETEVIGGIVIIGRTSPPRFIEEYARFEIPTPNRRETSITMRHGEKGVVDAVILTETNEGNRLLKVKIRDDRKPTLGDKFASRHGQKGVIGQIASQEDMPFTEDGIVPDLIINPHAMPSRMTVGQLIESATGIAAAMEGKPADGTPFIGITIKEIEKTLKKHGYHPAGETTLYDGITGEKYPARIYMGIVYMQRLHHLVADKIHARPRGPIQILTRQPTEGRAREGGLRFGEMERDCLIGHGAALLLKERLLEGSDKVEALICEKCGLLAVYDRSRDRYYCPVCDIGAKIANIEMSYAFKLLLQELMSLGIAPRLRLKEKA